MIELRMDAFKAWAWDSQCLLEVDSKGVRHGQTKMKNFSELFFFASPVWCFVDLWQPSTDGIVSLAPSPLEISLLYLLLPAQLAGAFARSQEEGTDASQEATRQSSHGWSSDGLVVGSLSNLNQLLERSPDIWEQSHVLRAPFCFFCCSWLCGWA